MDNKSLAVFWKSFFADLFTGTFIKLFLFTSAGFTLGLITLAAFKWTFLDPMELSGFLEVLSLSLGFIWYGAWGFLLSLLACALFIMIKKLGESVHGIHGLLDLLTRQVVEKLPQGEKQISKEELGRRFDNMGKEFLQNLKLKGGFLRWVSRFFFVILLKVLKLFFLDDVMDELMKKPSNQITPSDMEHAVRRVGAELIISPIRDGLIIFQILIGVLVLLLFAIPFGAIYFFI